MSRDKYASFLYKQTCSCHPPFFPWHFWILTITKIIFQLCLLQFQFQKWNIFILKMAKSRWCVYAIQNKYKTKLTFFLFSKLSNAYFGHNLSPRCIFVTSFFFWWIFDQKVTQYFHQFFSKLNLKQFFENYTPYIYWRLYFLYFFNPWALWLDTRDTPNTWLWPT